MLADAAAAVMTAERASTRTAATVRRRRLRGDLPLSPLDGGSLKGLWNIVPPSRTRLSHGQARLGLDRSTRSACG
jgi:hypothetical protein